MAADPELLAASRRAVLEEGVPAARAVLESGEVYAGALEASGDAYLAARATDVRDVCGRVARRLLGVPEQTLGSLTGPVVVVAHDIAPADVADLDTGHVRALVTEAGSRTSHTAILARALGVAAVVAVPALLDDLRDGVPVAVDGDSGRVLIDPGDIDRAGFEARGRASAERHVAAAGAPLADLRLADGTAVELAANVGSLADVEAAVALGARAVGLLRTELVYLGRAAPPGEDEQAALFSACADRLGGGRLVIRTFDFGADKPVPFLREAPGPNPALGVRGIRLARRHPELLETQLRAVAVPRRRAGDWR
jgi:phosphotransferase system enzyme I (PtsI)